MGATAMDMATAMATMATMARGRLSLLPLLRPPLLLSLATDTTDVVMATDTATVVATVTAMVTAMGMATVMDMATATTARGRLMPSPDMATTATMDTVTDMAMATDVAMDTAMDTATTVRERTDYLQS